MKSIPNNFYLVLSKTLSQSSGIALLFYNCMSIKSCSKNTTLSFNISHLFFPERRHGTCIEEYGVNRSDGRKGKRTCASPRAYPPPWHTSFTSCSPPPPPSHQTSIVSLQKIVKIISRTGLLNRVQAPNFKRYKLPRVLYYIM